MWTAALLQLLSGISLKDSGGGKYFKSAELQAAHLVVHFVLKEKLPGM